MDFRRKAEGELGGERAGGGEEIAVGIVDVLRGEVARFGDVGDDVAVVVVAGEMEHAVERDRKQSAHAARALLRAGEVGSPEAFARARRAVCEDDALKNDVAVVPDERVRRVGLPRAIGKLRHDLPRPAVAVIVAGIIRGRATISTFNGHYDSIHQTPS